MIDQDKEKRVLIIEDESDVAQLIRAVLEDEGYQVGIHPDGDCLDTIRAFQPDVVVCDYMLPGRDGQGVIAEIRQNLKLTVPVILVSAMRRATRNWREWGADDFLAKPFDIDALVGAVGRAAGTDAMRWSQPDAGRSASGERAS